MSQNTDQFGDPVYIKEEIVKSFTPKDWEVWQDIGIRVIIEQELEYYNTPFCTDNYPLDMLARIYEIVRVEDNGVVNWTVLIKEPCGFSGIPDRITFEESYESKDEALAILEDKVNNYEMCPDTNHEVEESELIEGKVNIKQSHVSHIFSEKTTLEPTQSGIVSRYVLSPYNRFLQWCQSEIS